jgi:hypothetical protein
VQQQRIINFSVSGGLLSQEFVEGLCAPRTSEQFAQAPTFAPPHGSAPTPAELEGDIAAAWELALENWDLIRGHLSRLLKDDVSAARAKWMRPLLNLLDFDPQHQAANIKVGEDEKLSFSLSHRGWKGDDAPIVHTVAPGQGLDDKTPGKAQRSPHDTLQTFLNSSSGDRWAVLTNGRSLRVLRDFYHTYTKGYVEFDLEGMFESRTFSDFRALYRLTHASRFVPDADGRTPLDHFYETSQAAGVAVGGDLRKNVKRAIERLANGFMTPELLERLRGSDEASREFYGEILQVVYRMLFLLFAEQRGLLPGRETMYAQEYSMAALREQAQGDLPRWDEHVDLWEGLKVTFRMMHEGVPELGIFAYDGMLFDPTLTPTLDPLACRNADLLAAVRDLTFIERGGVLQRISYVDLGVEELGSIYESLLDYAPRVAATDEAFEAEEHGRKVKYEVHAGQFFLDPRGMTRRSSGSYYTSPALVGKLVGWALAPTIEKRLAETGGEPKDREAALLDIKVCDPAMGSGAFLIAATNTLALYLARARTGDDYPPEAELRRARHDVLVNCIYGVDKNPMAVQLAKVSLWINAACPDVPLTFLDHHLKCGDSLVGATPELLAAGIPDAAFKAVSDDAAEKQAASAARKRNTQERERWQRDGAVKPEMPGLRVTLLDTAADLARWRTLNELAERDPGLAQTEYEKYRLSEPYRRPKLEADLWTAAFFWEPRTGAAAPTEGMLRTLQPNPAGVSSELLEELRRLAERYRFFHWHLEFPDVFRDRANPGFDCILGNPPFLGGKKISTYLGDRMLNYLKMRFPPAGGTADLCAYFYRQAFSLVRDTAGFGLIATNTISQGDTREAGLEPIVNQGGVIAHAVPSMKWPGDANLEVALVHVQRGPWEGGFELGGRAVATITPLLDDSSLGGTGKSLPQNANKSFIGSYVLGMGFVLDPPEADALLRNNSRNRDVIFPFLNGEDLNWRPDQSPSRWVINFHDWSLERASEYRDCLCIVKENVKPERDKVKRKAHRENWWLYADKRPGLYAAIAQLKRVMIRSCVSDLHMLAFVPTGWVYSHATTVFAFDDDYSFAVLQSNLHDQWLQKYSSSMRTDVRYTPSDCFETFPFPSPTSVEREEIAHIGDAYHQHRRQVMLARQLGLTKTYNLFHNPDCGDADIEGLRRLHVEMDQVVLAAYGWQDINPAHDFHEVERKKTRFTVSPGAKNEILRRLLELNHALAPGEAPRHYAGVEPERAEVEA